MTGKELRNLQEAYNQVHTPLDERMDPEERALRRAEVADKKASRMEPKVAAKYAGSEAKSAEREDKRSRGKHIHGMSDSYEVEGELVDEKFVKAQNPSTGRKSLPDRQSYKGTETEPFRGSDSRSLRHEIARSSGTSKKPKNEGRDYLGRDHGGSEEEHAANVRFGKRMEKLQGSVLGGKKETSEKKLKEAVYGGEKKEPEDTRMTVTAADKKANTPAWKKYQSGHSGYKAAPHLGEETINERELDPTETKEKERLVKGLKKSAKDFKQRYGERAKSVMYATATKMAKERMDTSKSDRRYGTEA